jgi:glycerol-3-phosphate O-acyltransferase/dihydroxyacetone phosphate acyltransferase
LPNHVNAFIDPVIIGMLTRRRIRFFARGDVFRGALAKRVLESMNISPMYRMSEGYSEVKKNDATFEECRRLLMEQKAILMFPEGICIQEKRIKRFKKGLARILLGIEGNAQRDEIQLMAIGLNYSNAKNFRSRLFINFGTPFDISAYAALYETDKVKAINDCTQFMQDELEKVIVSLSHRENDELYEAIAEIYVRQWMQEKGQDPKNQEAEYEQNKNIAAMLNRFQHQEPERIQAMKNKILPYFKTLDTLKLRDHLLRKDALEKMSLKSVLNDFFIMWFGLPLYWIGLVLNLLPYRIAKNMADEKAKNVEFRASIYANLGMILWIVFYVLQLVLIRSLFHSPKLSLLWIFLVPLSGIYAIAFYPVMKKTFGRWRLLSLVRKNKDEAERLINEREEIVRLIRQELNSAGFS